MNIETALEGFGLTDKEIKVYLALLSLGSALVQDIAAKAGTYRTYTYEILKSLQQKGLVGAVIKSGKQYFEAVEPEKLIDILKEKQEQIKTVMPELREVYKSSVSKPNIQIYIGKEGLKNILDDLVRTKKEILAYGSTERQIELLEFYFPNFIKRRIEAGIRTKVLSEESSVSRKLKKKDRKELRTIRFFPKGINLPTTTNIYGNKVAILSLKNDIFGVIIESEAIANTQRIIFSMLWQQSK